MYFNFVPKRLIQSREDISIIHANKRTPVAIQPNDELMKLIKRLASLELYQVRKNAFALSNEEAMKVAGYLPHNYYDVEMQNLFLVFRYRSNKEMCYILYNEWQDSYTDTSCNKYMRELLNYDENFIMMIRNNHLKESDFFEFLENSDIAYRLGRETYNHQFREGATLGDKLNYFGIRNNSRLYRNCAFLFFTYCEREDYLAVSKSELLTFIKKYGPGQLKSFLNNFLIRLELKDLQEFSEIAKYLISQTGEKNTDKFNTFFADFQSDLVAKYINWINIYKVYQYFGNDIRSNFWKRYRFDNITYYNYSNAVVMEFKNYYAVEFLGHNMGPIYIYEKEIFNQSVRRWFSVLNNSDLRSALFNNSQLYFYRKPHQGRWQYEVNSVLLRYNITERLNF